jgi:hypothetical protein
MTRISFLGGVLGGLGALTAAASIFCAGSAAAGGLPVHDVQASDKITSDALAGKFTAYIMPAKGYAGPRLVGKLPASRPKVPTLTFDLQGNLTAPQGPILQHYYPDDMGYYGGPVIASTTQVNFYFANNAGSIWGNPATFETALNTSAMIESLTHYTFQSKSDGHWPVSGDYWYYTGTPPTLIYDNQIQTYVQSIAAQDVAAGRISSANFGGLYHVFLPPGTDECFTDASQGCYNPDGLAPGPFAFCAYHSYTTLPSGQYIAYDVQPYAEVNGCEQSGQYVEAQDQANVLGHETAEAISDAIPGYGWYAEWPTGGGEIGDECAFVPIEQKLSGKVYYIQDWYSTAHHECANTY